MARRRGNPAIVSVGDRRRTGSDGRPVSHGTQAAFNKFKRNFNERLQADGVHQLKPRNLKPKHINSVVARLRARGWNPVPFRLARRRTGCRTCGLMSG